MNYISILSYQKGCVCRLRITDCIIFAAWSLHDDSGKTHSKCYIGSFFLPGRDTISGTDGSHQWH